MIEDVHANLNGTCPTHTDGSPATGHVVHFAAINYARPICNLCKEPITLSWMFVDGYAVCYYCYELHHITYNPVEKCPYKQPKSRKFPTRPEPVKFELSQGVTGQASVGATDAWNNLSPFHRRQE